MLPRYDRRKHMHELSILKRYAKEAVCDKSQQPTDGKVELRE